MTREKVDIKEVMKRAEEKQRAAKEGKIITKPEGHEDTGIWK